MAAKAPASASKPTAMTSAAATPVVPHAPEAGAPETNAAQRAPTHVGWIVQIGAFDIERDAQRQLSLRANRSTEGFTWVGARRGAR
jgi:cell division septation protein DedD